MNLLESSRLIFLLRLWENPMKRKKAFSWIYLLPRWLVCRLLHRLLRPFACWQMLEFSLLEKQHLDRVSRNSIKSHYVSIEMKMSHQFSNDNKQEKWERKIWQTGHVCQSSTWKKEDLFMSRKKKAKYSTDRTRKKKSRRKEDEGEKKKKRKKKIYPKKETMK